MSKPSIYNRLKGAKVILKAIFMAVTWHLPA